MFVENPSSEKTDISLSSATGETEDGGPKQTLTDVSILDCMQARVYQTSISWCQAQNLNIRTTGPQCAAGWGK